MSVASPYRTTELYPAEQSEGVNEFEFRDCVILPDSMNMMKKLKEFYEKIRIN